MEKIISLCKRRGFVFPGSEIYGGLANSWDFGPLGVELKNNIKTEWWNRFVRRRADMVGIETALIMSPKVWEASGHLKEFSDPLVECKKCHSRFRADQDNGSLKAELVFLKEAEADGENPMKVSGKVVRYRLSGKCPVCDSPADADSFTSPASFNLMLKTFLGPAQEKANEVYFRPETAQGMFVNFKNVLNTTRRKLPFGIAQIGKAFRNEITPGNFIFRTREFEQMEIEYFIPEPKADHDWQKYFEHWKNEMKSWLRDLGVSESRLHFEDIPEGERAHYSKRTMDVEYDFPFGRKELYGLAYRGNFDLSAHAQGSGEDLQYTDPETGAKFIPHVIEPTWGVERTALVALLEAYSEEKTPSTDGEGEARTVLKFPFWLAPVKIAVLPLSKKEELSAFAKPLFETLIQHFACEYDETQSIGKRYRRQDEIGTPFCVTVDFDSLKDRAVTVRHRDTMEQERVPIENLVAHFSEKFAR